MHIDPKQLMSDINDACALELTHKPYHILKRESHLLVTSVHGFSHERAGAIKAPDEGSFVFSYLLAKHLNANWAAVGVPLEKDSNYYKDTQFKVDVFKELGSHIDYAFDIHACHALRAFDLEVGTAYRAESKQDISLVSSLSSVGYYCVINEIFKARGNGLSQTMTDFWNTNGKTALQLEIASCYLTGDTRLEWHERVKLLHFLINAIDKYVIDN